MNLILGQNISDEISGTRDELLREGIFPRVKMQKFNYPVTRTIHLEMKI
jgi:hypothetical protein